MSKQRISLPKIPSSEITPESLYHSRRKFLKSAGIISAGAFLAACGVKVTDGGTAQPSDAEAPLTDTQTPFDTVTNYNNYYEFTTDKARVAVVAKDFSISPWDVEVGGMVRKPKTYSIDEIMAAFPSEERVYRMRCVEGWSMVIPWLGFPLADLLTAAEPTSDAKFVHFTSIFDPEEMPGQQGYGYPWPYSEGLSLDEAMHDLTILSIGLYGKTLLPQCGAPLRLVVPWKYGFKSAKAIVKIELVDKQPDTFWNLLSPEEYGFYSNVNPDVPHPRWSQATERRLGESGRRPTLRFNGYEDQVGSLYTGMDLTINY